MTATCAIVALALAGPTGPAHTEVIRPSNPVSLAAGDTLGMALMETMTLPVQTAQATQPSQSGAWWDMPATETVVARSFDR